jgi:hypothetical protein
MTDWNKGVDLAIKNFNEKTRVYPSDFSLLLVDYLVLHNPVPIDWLHKFLTEDFISTTLGHVTTPVHGSGSVPKVGGWYSRDDGANVYNVNFEFATAWKIARGIGHK